MQKLLKLFPILTPFVAEDNNGLAIDELTRIKSNNAARVDGLKIGPSQLIRTETTFSNIDSSRTEQEEKELLQPEDFLVYPNEIAPIQKESGYYGLLQVILKNTSAQISNLPHLVHNTGYLSILKETFGIDLEVKEKVPLPKEGWTFNREVLNRLLETDINQIMSGIGNVPIFQQAVGNLVKVIIENESAAAALNIIHMNQPLAQITCGTFEPIVKTQHLDNTVITEKRVLNIDPAQLDEFKQMETNIRKQHAEYQTKRDVAFRELKRIITEMNDAEKEKYRMSVIEANRLQREIDDAYALEQEKFEKLQAELRSEFSNLTFKRFEPA